MGRPIYALAMTGETKESAVERIVSGGQTGADRAALDVALELGLACGGWVPRGRRAEDGPIDRRYPVRETEETDVAARTRLNVRDSDATLILTAWELRGGTALTARVAAELGRPLRIADPATGPGPVRDWLVREEVRVLNVAGPRESEEPGLQARAAGFLRRLLRGPED